MTPLDRPPLIRRRTALAAAAAALAWRPASVAARPLPGAAEQEALHLLERAAGGPAPGDLERVVAMGRAAWIAEQLEPERLELPAALAARLAALDSPRRTQGELVQRYRALGEGAKEQAARPASAGSTAQATTDADTRAASDTPQGRERRALVQRVHQDAAESRLLQALASPRQLQEVLVDFWFNHFNVYDGKALVHVLVENYEREAIRPHVLGRFRTLLGATAKHPAMLFYLDNWLSVAPGYAPRRRAADGVPGGLNENYARELMELHTLGVDGGYTQQDVTELARMLTGWTFGARGPGKRGRGAPAGAQDGGTDRALFHFDPARHDAGAKTWLGHAVEPAGQAEGEFALDILARHPATARHIATKLARHFVSDEPPARLVGQLARRFLDTDGDLRDLLKTLLDSAEFRAPEARRAKFKTPYQVVVSSVRASAIAATNVRPLLSALAQLGQPLFGCQTPDGYADTEAAWLNPGAIAQRVNFATTLAAGRLPLLRLDDAAHPAGAPGQAGVLDAMQADAGRPPTEGAGVSTPPVDATRLLETLGPAISDKTRTAIAAAAPPLHAALALGSPDFMRH